MTTHPINLGRGLHLPLETNRANAQLIAKAPEMKAEIDRQAARIDAAKEALRRARHHMMPASKAALLVDEALTQLKGTR